MTQTMKIQRINECGISLPPSVHFIAADLTNEDLVSAFACSCFRERQESILLVARRFGVPDTSSQSGSLACSGNLRCPGKRTCIHLY
ncbi:hypothetical protein IVB16_23320 [Bradyrhizobium sp. 183]|nr:hypothetical protein [Bradyrhizobium sp. 156]MCK1354940.1 hypothetical protein [Bradyrhizobium sp. CW7]MCK1412401.1 hypothetical protein [Bradyrhizobium sp. CW4]MCK1496933.1 hypothetical protein [Bradyrhizobium sp. 188]MCK1551789.1 hypothetical protein [Bradyrhizobium sp. 177]MCK1573517.1 hypothetical protein [Bradyrhizobium sp. 174]MCK1700893.1 hypothetical protein [Bradyrhizobium sp. 146]UPJ24900.1 hypothetical protein IVB54_23725 [Bradyrhizobium sp. CW1]UPJ77832.1 hypothetical protein